LEGQPFCTLTIAQSRAGSGLQACVAGSGALFHPNHSAKPSNLCSCPCHLSHSAKPIRVKKATAGAQHKSRQSLGDARSIRWQLRFDTPPKPQSTVPTGASFLLARPVGQSVFIPSRTKVPAPTHCEQRALPTVANCGTARAHAPLKSRAALAAPKGASSLRNHGTHPPLQTGAAQAKTAKR